MKPRKGGKGYSVHINECAAVGFDDQDEAEVASIARRLARCGRDAERLGLTIFGGAGSADLRKRQVNDGLSGAFIVASVTDGMWDGGDGGNYMDEHDLLRGES